MARSLLLVVVGYLVLVEIVLQLAFGRIDIPGVHIGFLEVGRLAQPVPRGIFVQGAVVGSLYGLLAIGLVLIHRANRVINFAQAGLGAVPAVLALVLVARHGLPYGAALAVAVVGSALLGAGAETTVMRRMDDRPRLMATVATIGISIVLVFFELLIPTVIKGKALPTSQLPGPFSHIRFNVGIVRFSGDHVMTVLVTVAVCAGLTAFLHRSDTGIAIRAAAENGDRANLLGIPVRRLSTIVWTVAAVLSGVAIFLRAAIVGLPLGGSVGLGVLLFGLAAAVIARMESLPVAALAGVAIGIIEQTAVFSTRSSVLAEAVMVVVILGALAVQRGTRTRLVDSATSSWQEEAEVRPIPAELRAHPRVRRVLWASNVVLVTLVVALPMLVGATRTDQLSVAVIYAIVGISLVVLTGWAGQISLGQFGFAGIGAAVAGGLAANHHWDFFAAVIVAGLVGAAVATLVGLPAVRLPGLYLAVTTLAFSFAVQNVVLNPRYFGWLLPKDFHFVDRPILYGRVEVSANNRFYYLCLLFLGLAAFLARAFRRYRSGRVVLASRDNPRQLQALSVSPVRTRLAAFALSGYLAATAGALLAYQQGSVDALTFSPTRSLEVFAATVIGGISAVAGAIIGAAYITGFGILFQDYFKSLLRSLDNDVTRVTTLLNGVGLLLILIKTPGGLAAAGARRDERWARKLAGVDHPTFDAQPPAPPIRTTDRSEDDHRRPDTVLAGRRVDVSYGSQQVLFGVDFTVGRGEAVALLGTNGAGKSTLLKAIAGLLAPTGGEICVGGAVLPSGRSAAAVEAGVVLVPGGRAVFPSLTVAEHLRIAGWSHRNDPAHLAAARDRAYATFPRLLERSAQPAGNLSGGEQQMLGIAMAFLAKPRVLMIDELSLGLAPAVVAQLLDVVRSIRADGTAVVLVEQSLNVAAAAADRAYFLERGTVRFEGPTADLLDDRDLARSVFLAAASTASIAFAERPDREQGPALDARGLVRTFGGIRAVDDADLRVERGAIVGIIGPNGAGKTTLLDLVSGFLAPELGSITLGHVDITAMGPSRRAELGLGRMFQDARLVPSLSVNENIALGFDRHLAHHSHLAAALALPVVARQELDLDVRVAELVELLRLGQWRDLPVRELSTGTRRVVEIAVAMAHRPDVLLLDEPSSGLAQREVEALAPLLDRIRSASGCAMVVIEHDIPFVTSIASTLVAMDLGRPIAVGRPDDVLSDPRVVESYLGSDQTTIERSARPNLVAPT